MSQAGARLFANVGAEDIELEQASARARAIAETVSQLWSLLFDAEVRLLPFHSRTPWADALGARPTGPAFPWLPTSGGVAWLQTDAALAAMRKVGVTPTGVSAAVVRAVHDKAFAVTAARELNLEPACLAGHSVVFDVAHCHRDDFASLVTAAVSAWPAWMRGRYLLKPRWGTSGRGGFRGGPDLAPSGTVAVRLAQRGGAILEPWLDRIDDFSTQLVVLPSGEVEAIATTAQVLSTRGTPRANRGMLDGDRIQADDPVHADLTTTAIAIAARASQRGYRGPCGVDSFRFTGPDGNPELRPLVELNARFTTGMIGTGLVRRAVASGLAHDGDRWCFSLAGRPEGFADAREVVLTGGSALYLQAAHARTAWPAR